jgi:hypothetical protein
MARVYAPLAALALTVALGILAALIVWPFDANGSGRLGIAVATPFAAIAVTLATAIVAFARPSRWKAVGACAVVPILVALVVGLLAPI